MNYLLDIYSILTLNLLHGPKSDFEILFTLYPRQWVLSARGCLAPTLVHESDLWRVNHFSGFSYLDWL